MDPKLHSLLEMAIEIYTAMQEPKARNSALKHDFAAAMQDLIQYMADHEDKVLTGN